VKINIFQDSENGRNKHPMSTSHRSTEKISQDALVSEMLANRNITAVDFKTQKKKKGIFAKNSTLNIITENATTTHFPQLTNSQATVTHVGNKTFKVTKQSFSPMYATNSDLTETGIHSPLALKVVPESPRFLTK